MSALEVHITKYSLAHTKRVTGSTVAKVQAGKARRSRFPREKCVQHST